MNKILFQKEFSFGKFETFSQRPSINILTTKQIHSNKVSLINDLNKNCESDGIQASIKNFPPLAIITADCLPIVIAGEHQVVFLHAGWRGLASGILSSPEVMSINPKFVYLGPHISFDSYEVSPEFKDNFPNSPNAFKVIDNRIFFSLELETRRQIKDLYGKINVESSNICTNKEVGFHSYRRNQTALRNWNILKRS